MTQISFTPPTRDPAVDIMQHIWASKYAIASWESQTPKLVEIRVSEEVEALLRWHPRLTNQSIAPVPANSIWGIPIVPDYSLESDPGYVISYIRGGWG